ncbi:helix-turn-helix domain-containing protein [Mameliella alba]|uniref:helix-turn-helix domain-containing protein n=1 Tax=Mameliella TaxID=1434019 RepID=UPI001C966887|nr:MULTISPECIES: helix-turn-helix transcriptional regulator [Mameliella]MBY6120238.1 helix-turn-helix domain-containing protein [Mameliella alba]MDD9733127.1 helix-turn-helix transcriptional regulator [Mameliella sp. AT18]
MGVPEECSRIESRLAEAGRTVAEMCNEAGLARSTWQRWKSGAVVPKLNSWGDVGEAVDKLCAPAAPKEDAA